MDFWKHNPKFFVPLSGSLLKSGKDLFDEQINHLGSAMLVEDYDANVEVLTTQINATCNFNFPPGALVSGSFVMHHVAHHIGNINHAYDDVDVYFKSKADAQLFLTMNNAQHHLFSSFDNIMCSYGYIEGLKFNLIYGVDYKSPEHLISRFDIRACSMAIDISTMTLYVVKGAIEDSTAKRLAFNPVPRGCTIRRLTKYIKKGFEIDGYQSLFFTELIRSNIYSAELELMTKEY